MQKKIALIEDNVQAVELMKGMISDNFPDLIFAGTADTVSSGKNLIEKERPDILMVDIQLRDGSIFDLLESVSKELLEDTSLIFITAYGTVENIYRALRLSAIDYLIKPIDEEHFLSAVQEAMQNGSRLGIGNQIEYFLSMVHRGVQSLQLPKMPIHLPKGVIEFTPWDDIIYIKGEENICYFFLVNDRKLVSTRNIGYYYQSAEENGLFFQISKSQIINLKHLERYHHLTQTVEMAGGHSITASRRGGSRLLQYLRGKSE